jgi:signal transduction histidine kinase
MERIIEDVLTLARGEDVVEPDEPVDLGTAAESAWDTVETDNAALTIDRPMPTTVADPDRIKRLFENLFRNAVEHGSTLPETQPGQSGDELSRPNPPTGEATDGNGEREASGVTVSVGGLTDESVDGFYVADDGPGIAPAARERVFDPGYTSDDHGTGLGLAIVERIVDLHGWSIAVTTGTDGGARFEITGLEPT